MSEIENPYLSLIKDYFPYIKTQFNKGYEWTSNTHRKYYRQDLIMKFSYAIPDDNAIECIAEYSPLVEVGAGLGYWSYLLHQHGADIEAYDIALGDDNKWFCNEETRTGAWFPVKQCDAEFVPPCDRTLLLCWPPYDDNMAFNVLSRYSGDKLIYIGEDIDGCCGNEKFFNLLYKKWKEVEYIRIPQWTGLHDFIFIYKKR